MGNELDIEIGDDDKNKHSKGARINQFCALRKEPCTCEKKNKYTDVINSEKAKESAKYLYPQRFKYKDGTYETKWISENAHHLVCVASVTELFAKDTDIQPIIANEVYCINEKINMIALPLWSHTIFWYMFDNPNKAPAFENWPNHNYDHDLYISELKEDLEKLARIVKKAGHKNNKGKIANKLNKLSGSYRNKLRTRGKRMSGTHSAWTSATDPQKPNQHWYRPFSMASTSMVTERAFAVRKFDDEVMTEFEKILKAL